MKKTKLFSIVMFVLVVGFVGCKKDDTTVSPTEIKVDESALLVSYLETNGDYINTSAPSVVAATTVFQDLSANPPTQYIVDIRDSAAFVGGHIQGAHRVAFGDLLTHVKSINATSYNRIVVVCYSGQTAAYGASILRLMGYSNVSSLKWGMCSWDSSFAKGKWLDNTKNTYASQFSTTATAKNAKGSLPILTTGKTTGKDILEARVNDLLSKGYTAATISNSSLFANLSGHYIVNYWPLSEYNLGHIPGAVQYVKPDLRDSLYLRTLPTDKPVVAYCYTGQTSSYLAAYLRALGYDARTLLYGANAMIYDTMPGTKFAASEIKGYAYVTGN